MINKHISMKDLLELLRKAFEAGEDCITYSNKWINIISTSSEILCSLKIKISNLRRELVIVHLIDEELQNEFNEIYNYISELEEIINEHN